LTEPVKALIKGLVKRAGIYYARRRYMPCGIDWLWDVQRIIHGRRLGIVFDVGANVGETTVTVKARFPDAEVHAFEPVTGTYQTLEKNVGHLGKVTCHRIALCDRIGSATMTAATDSPLNRLLGAGETSPHSREVETVDTETIDHFCALHNVERIDILKIDAEGADLSVLQGASAMLTRGRVAFVFVEVGFERDDVTHVHLPRICEFLANAGLRPYSFYDYCRLKPPHYEEEGLGLVFANILFVSSTGIQTIQ
jgi:FkbM family methyltransferase